MDVLCLSGQGVAEFLLIDIFTFRSPRFSRWKHGMGPRSWRLVPFNWNHVAIEVRSRRFGGGCNSGKR